MRITKAPEGITERCSYCQVIINHFSFTTAGWELKMCGVTVTFSEAPPATHFCYPHTGAMENNADPICAVHARMLEFQGSNLAFEASEMNRETERLKAGREAIMKAHDDAALASKKVIG